MPEEKTSNEFSQRPYLQSVCRSVVPKSVLRRHCEATKRRKLVKPEFEATKTIFIHIPRAASSSIGVALYGHDRPAYSKVGEYLSQLGEARFEYLIFSFVRHPLDRFRSAYNYLSKSSRNASDSQFGKEVISKYSDINDFAENWLSEENIWNYIHFYPQNYFIFDKDCLSVDFLGRFENINSDFERLASLINLKDKRLTIVNETSRRSEELRLSALAVENIYRVYKTDFDLLGYE